MQKNDIRATCHWEEAILEMVRWRARSRKRFCVCPASSHPTRGIRRMVHIIPVGVIGRYFDICYLRRSCRVFWRLSVFFQKYHGFVSIFFSSCQWASTESKCQPPQSHMSNWDPPHALIPYLLQVKLGPNLVRPYLKSHSLGNLYRRPPTRVHLQSREHFSQKVKITSSFEAFHAPLSFPSFPPWPNSWNAKRAVKSEIVACKRKMSWGRRPYGFLGLIGQFCS